MSKSGLLNVWAQSYRAEKSFTSPYVAPSPGQLGVTKYSSALPGGRRLGFLGCPRRTDGNLCCPPAALMVDCTTQVDVYTCLVTLMHVLG